MGDAVHDSAKIHLVHITVYPFLVALRTDPEVTRFRTGVVDGYTDAGTGEFHVNQ